MPVDYENDESVQEQLSHPEFSTVRAFIAKKAAEMWPTPDFLARKWLLRLIMGWSGPKLWSQIRSNQRKLEVALRIYKTHFMGCSLDHKAPSCTLKFYRNMLTDALRGLDARAGEARRRHNDRKNGPPALQTPQQTDYFDPAHIKLVNDRTARKNIDLPATANARATRAKPTKRARTTPPSAPRRVSNSGSKPIPQWKEYDNNDGSDDEMLITFMK